MLPLHQSGIGFHYTLLYGKCQVSVIASSIPVCSCTKRNSDMRKEGMQAALYFIILYKQRQLLQLLMGFVEMSFRFE